MREVILNFTEQCNGRCTTCDLWRIEEPKTLPTELVEQALASSALKGLEVVYLTGGEPFMADQCIDIAAAIKRHHPSAIITGATNALDPFAYARRIGQIRYGLYMRLRPSVSLNGGPEWHDHTRGVPGSYDNARNMMAILRQMRCRFDVAYLDMGRVAEYEHVCEIAKSWNVPVGVTRQRCSARYGQAPEAHERFVFPCQAPHAIICIWPDGRVTACEEDDPELILGNLYGTPLEDMAWDHVSAYVGAGSCQPCTMTCFAGKW